MKCKDIHLGKNGLAGLNKWVAAQKDPVVVLCEKHAARLLMPVLLASCPVLRGKKVYFLNASEPGKQIETLVPLWKKWLKDGVDRHTWVINVGGGVLCDMGGFAASVYMRGLKFINVPTTLLAMADASVGGKTAVDLGEVKNVVGTFTRPQAVYIDPVFLDTLPERQINSGIAEIIKMRCIADSRFRPADAEKFFTDRRALLKGLRFAVEKKDEITRLDFKEDGLRKNLNFGHTVGHALEAYSLKTGKPLLHGEAVAWGMVYELYWSCQLAGFPQSEYEEFRQMISRHYPALPDLKGKKKTLSGYMKKDKKNKDGKVCPVLLSAWGMAKTYAL